MAIVVVTATKSEEARPLLLPQSRVVQANADLATHLQYQLMVLGLDSTVSCVAMIPERKTPMVEYESAGMSIVLAGDNEHIKKLNAACIADTVDFPAALRLLVAHILTLLNFRLTEMTDSAERHTLQELLKG